MLHFANFAKQSSRSDILLENFTKCHYFSWDFKNGEILYLSEYE